MTTHSIGGAGALRPLVPATPPPTFDGGGEGQFASLLAGLGEMQGEADTALADLAIGGDRDLHDVVLAVEMEPHSNQMPAVTRRILGQWIWSWSSSCSGNRGWGRRRT